MKHEIEQIMSWKYGVKLIQCLTLLSYKPYGGMFVWQNRKKEETSLEFYDFKYKCSVSIINKPVKQG